MQLEDIVCGCSLSLSQALGHQIWIHTPLRNKKRTRTVDVLAEHIGEISMGLTATLNGSARGNGFLLAPSGGRTFPVQLALRTDNGTRFTVTLAVSPGGAGIEIDPSVIEVGPDEVTVTVRALTPS